MSAYILPGVRMQQQKRFIAPSGSASDMIQVIMTTGPKTLKKTFKVRRADSGQFDTILDSNGDYLDITAIVSVGKSPKTSDYNVDTHMNDLAIDTMTVDGKTVKALEWATVAANVINPLPGEIYYVTVTYTPSDKHYGVRLFTDINVAMDEYGSDVIDGVINPAGLAAEIALSKSSAVYIKKIKAAADSPSSAETLAALEEIKYIREAYRVTPVGLPQNLKGLIVDHVRKMSDPEEGFERVCGLGAPEPTNNQFSTILSEIGALSEGYKEQRCGIVYPSTADMILSDGKKYTVSSDYIMVEIFATRQTMRVMDSYTGMSITSFVKLNGPRLSRIEKRQLIAKGIMYVEQEKEGVPGKLVHGVTTDMSGIQEREFALVELSDYWTRSLRPINEAFIGKTIADTFMVKYSGALEAKIAENMKNGYGLIGTKLLNYGQILEQPDNVYSNVTVSVPYPCNNISVTVATV